MKRSTFALAAVVAFIGVRGESRAGVILGSAENFALLASQTITNTGPSTVHGDVGLYPGTSITGFGTVALTGTQHVADSVAQQAQMDNVKAYNALAAMTGATNLTGQDLGGKTLDSGVYKFSSSAGLTGALTLDAQGNNNAFWVFQIGSTLTTASASSVKIINLGSNGGSDDGVFWQVGSSATLGTTTQFEGNILALASTTLTTGANIQNGRVLVQTASITMDTNIVTLDSQGFNNGSSLSGGLIYDNNGNVVPVGPKPGPGPAPGPGPGPAAVPEPSTIISAGLACVISLLARARRRKMASSI